MAADKTLIHGSDTEPDAMGVSADESNMKSACAPVVPNAAPAASVEPEGETAEGEDNGKQITPDSAGIQSAEEILGSAQEQADRLISDAREQADKLVAEAKRRSDALISDAQQRAEEMLAGAAAEAEEHVKTLEAQHLARIMDEQRLASDQVIETALAEERKLIGYADSQKRLMESQNRAIQREWITSLDDTLEQLKQVRTGLYQHMENWRNSLYPVELLPIAQLYVDLYGFVKLDKMLQCELLFGEKACGDGAVHEDILAKLEKLNCTMTIFLRRYETALRGLGLYAFYPRKGDPYDELLHLCANDNVDPKGQTVTCCRKPGVAKKAPNYGEGDPGTDEDVILVRAIVAV